MTGKEIKEEVDNYLIKTREERKNAGLAKVPEFDERDVKQAYRDGLQSGLWHHSYDYLVKTADLKKRYKTQKEINKELVDENAELKEKLKPENCLKLLAKEGYVKFTCENGNEHEQLTKAKEIIKKLIEAIHIWDCKNLEEVEAEAEQFLKGEFTTELPNEWHNLKKDPQDLPKKDGLYLIARANYQGPEYDTVRYWTADQKFTGAYLFEEKPIAWLEIPAFKEEEK